MRCLALAVLRQHVAVALGFRDRGLDLRLDTCGLVVHSHFTNTPIGC